MYKIFKICRIIIIVLFLVYIIVLFCSFLPSWISELFAFLLSIPIGSMAMLFILEELN